MGNTERIRKALEAAKGKPKPAPQPPPKKQQGGLKRFQPPAVRRNDKKLQGKPRLPDGVMVAGFWKDGQWRLIQAEFHPLLWLALLELPKGRFVLDEASKLFGGLHELDDKFREQLKAAGYVPAPTTEGE